MLVATALTLIILLIFAQVFRAATRTIGIQRGIGQNDARARMFNTIIRSDLQKATFRDHPASTSRGLLTLGIHDLNELGFAPVHRDQAGYWYISENDPNNDIDDVLQFTVSVDQIERSKESHPYIGRASQIGRPAGATGTGFNPQALAGNPDQNQPEFDDGNNANGGAQSRYAEVCYFVRNGTLYRRVMLLRDPLSIQAPGYSVDPDYFEQGGATPGRQPLIPGDYDSVADFEATAAPGDGGDFWNDFDFAAYHQDPLVTTPTPAAVKFLGKDSLSNSGRGIGNRLSDPKFRFGFQYRSDLTAAYALAANPVEYVDSGATFIGRFTHQETSSPDFRWPASFNAVNNPLIQTDLTLQAGVVRDTSRGVTFNNGPRRGEDILLTNVDAFDVKLFEVDTSTYFGLGAFVDVGHSGTGVLSASLRKNPTYGPRTPGAGIANNIFDTWHQFNINYGRAPFRPVYADPLSAVSATNPRLPVSRTSWDWEFNQPYDIRNTSTGTPGSRIYPFPLPDSASAVAPDVGPDGKPGQADTDDDGVNGIDDRGELGWPASDDVVNRQYDGLYYEAVALASGASGSSDATTRPVFLKRYGHRVIDNGILWQCFDNRVGVSLIQITIRYRDPDSNLSRQVTIQHSLTDRSE